MDITPLYLLDELETSQSYSLAFADTDQKIVWFNKNFRNELNLKRVTGRKISGLFPNAEQAIYELNGKKEFYTNLLGTNKRVKIKRIIVKNEFVGFFIKIEPTKEKDEIEENNSNLLQNKFDFPKVVQNILSLLVKETSLDGLIREVLKSASLISGSNFGIVILFGERGKYEFNFYDPENNFDDKNEIEKGINSNLSFIKKWLVVNKKAFKATNSPENIGYNLTSTLKCKSVIVAPCFFDHKTIAALMIGSFKKDYTPLEITHTENISSILSFAITSIRTKELNDTLESKLQQSQKLETIGKLSSGMAHDFNNLLSSIFGSLNLLRKKLSDREDVFKLLDNIESCSIRAKDLTRGLLSYGKPTPRQKELIKPKKIISEINKVVEQTFPKEVIFNREIENNLHDILGSSTEIYQILLNLCVNAKEAINGKGKLFLSVKNLNVNSANAIDHPMLDKGNYVWFSVKDNGTGIDEENISKIFDPYFSTKGKETGSGSGLGLYVSYGIIKAHNGHVDVSSKKGEGTTFDVFLPAYEPNKKITKDTKEKIILLADDEVMLRDLLGELLESSGYNVIKVISGAEVLKVLTEEIKVDLAIIDYNMPGMSGLECISKIRELKFDIPIVLSSGSMSITQEFNLENAGINSVLPKPYEFDMMLETIRKLF